MTIYKYLINCWQFVLTCSKDYRMLICLNENLFLQGFTTIIKATLCTFLMQYNSIYRMFFPENANLQPLTVLLVFLPSRRLVKEGI